MIVNMGSTSKHSLNSVITPVFSDASAVKLYTDFSNSMIQEGALVNGVFVIPSDLNPFVWFGVIFVDEERNGGGPSHWNGGVFRFVVKLSQDLTPTVTFLPLTPQGSLKSHPDVNPDNGSYKHTGGPVFKLIKALRKSFYKTHASCDANVCKQDVESSASLLFTDNYVKTHYKGDKNAMVLGTNAPSVSANATVTPSIGLSFF